MAKNLLVVSGHPYHRREIKGHKMCKTTVQDLSLVKHPSILSNLGQSQVNQNSRVILVLKVEVELMPHLNVLENTL